MPQPLPDRSNLQAGIHLLRRPLLPLVRLCQLLYLTGPFNEIEELLSQLNEPLTTAGIDYPAPAQLLAPHREALQLFTALKRPGPNRAGEYEAPHLAAPRTHSFPGPGAQLPPPPMVLNEQDQPLARLEALEAVVCHAVLTAELAQINSLLCGPCRCTLCCTGPTPEMSQDFFEIPLAPAELELFSLPRHDSPASRSRQSSDEPPLLRGNLPFYRDRPALYHWQSGWSLILPRAGRCPQLNDRGGCQIYLQRPEVCRRPQIFPYLLETDAHGHQRLRHKLLAVWDCPYVQALRGEIIFFAEASGLEPVFRTNKR